MIVAERKPFEEIMEMLAGRKSVLVLGCGGCVSVCLTGGERQAETLATQIKLAADTSAQEMTVDYDCITRQCDREFAGDLTKDPRQYDAVVSIACGAGVGFMSEIMPEVTYLPGMNTTFLAASVEQGIWAEYCQGCGDCHLAWTGGLCPIARCSKNMLNGPCGGTNKAMCEINPDMTCGWQDIYDRLKELGQLDNLKKVRPARNHRNDRGQGVRRMVLSELVEEEATNE